jgi:hypothetical protein
MHDEDGKTPRELLRESPVGASRREHSCLGPLPSDYHQRLCDLMNEARWQEATYLLIQKVDDLYRNPHPSRREPSSTLHEEPELTLVEARDVLAECVARASTPEEPHPFLFDTMSLVQARQVLGAICEAVQREASRRELQATGVASSKESPAPSEGLREWMCATCPAVVRTTDGPPSWVHSFAHVHEWKLSATGAAAETPAPSEGLRETTPALMTYMLTNDPRDRDAAFIETYAQRILDGTAATWEIPSTVAGTLKAIAQRMKARQAATGAAAETPAEDEIQQLRRQVRRLRRDLGCAREQLE